MRNHITTAATAPGHLHLRPSKPHGRGLPKAREVASISDTSDSVGLGGTGIYMRGVNDGFHGRLLSYTHRIEGKVSTDMEPSQDPPTRKQGAIFTGTERMVDGRTTARCR